jgi:YVTN family beta-propeller protein
MTKICKKHFYQITTKSFNNSKFTSYKLNQYNTMYFSFFAIFLMIASFSLFQFADAADDRTRLEAELIHPSTGKDDGKAKFEQRDDRTTFTVEIEDQNQNSVYEIRADDNILGTLTTDDSGFADFNLDSRDGDYIPHLTSGSWVQVLDSNGTVVLSGQLIGDASTQDTTAPPPDSEPILTSSVIIPLGAKDKDVSEFYVPKNISVNLGETITWTNQDDTEHTVTSKTRGIFDSGVFGPGQSFSHQFTDDGTYDYFCALHPYMVGTVTAGKGGTVSSPVEPNPSPEQSSTPTTPQNLQGSSLHTISIPSGAAEQTITEFYVPNSISIKVSDSVVWKNDDIGFHTVTSGKGTPDGFFDSGLYGPSESFSFQFNKPGSFEYYCTVHPWMTGVVSVSGEAQPEPTIPSEKTEPSIGSDKTQPDISSERVPSPIAQIKKGVSPNDVICNPGKNLLFKVSDDMPVCLNITSIPKLIERGWAKYDSGVTEHQDTSPNVPGNVFFTLQGDDSVGTINGDIVEAGPKMTYVSVSKDGDLILATSSASDKVFAYDSQGNKLSEISVGKTPKGVKIHPTRNIAFIANENSGSVSVLDITNLKIIKEIEIGKIPHNIVFHPNGLTAYVTVQGADEIAVVDVGSLEKIDAIPIGNLPHNLDITPDGQRLFVTNIGTNDVSVIDLPTRDLVKKIPVSKGHHGIDIPPFGDRVFVSGIGDDKVNVIDATSLEVIEQIVVGNGPHGLRSDFVSKKLYVGVTQTDEIVVIDTKSLTIIERLSTGKTPFWIAVAGNP